MRQFIQHHRRQSYLMTLSLVAILAWPGFATDAAADDASGSIRSRVPASAGWTRSRSITWTWSTPWPASDLPPSALAGLP
jgi:hypothetical protein